jgi:hypothetical protein
MTNMLDISVRGKRKLIPSVEKLGVTVLISGKLLKKAEIFDEYWLEAETLPSPDLLISELSALHGRPDLFTFIQRVPDNKPKYDHYYTWENYAVLPVSSYENWLNNQIHSTTKRNIRASEKRGIEIRVSEYDENYVKGIMSIYNESPLRAGRKFWHYGKDFETVKRENGTYSERSTYLAAYYQGEMVGYLKIVWDKKTAAIMQILSKLSVRDNRPNNALLAEAVKQCCLREVNYLIYEKYDYGNKTGDSLTRFKQSNGFIRMDIPQYHVPLTTKGACALRLGLYQNISRIVPEWIAVPAREFRTKLHETFLNYR